MSYVMKFISPMNNPIKLLLLSYKGIFNGLKFKREDHQITVYRDGMPK